MRNISGRCSVFPSLLTFLFPILIVLVTIPSALAQAGCSYSAGNFSCNTDFTTATPVGMFGGSTSDVFNQQYGPSWNNSLTVGGTYNASAFGVDLGTYGAELNASSSGHVFLRVNAQEAQVAPPGGSAGITANVSYGNIQVSVPQTSTPFRPGQTFTVTSTPGTTTSSFNSSASNFGAGLGVNLQLNASLGGEACVGGCVSGNLSLNGGFNQQIIALNENSNYQLNGSGLSILGQSVPNSFTYDAFTVSSAGNNAQIPSLQASGGSSISDQVNSPALLSGNVDLIKLAGDFYPPLKLLKGGIGGVASYTIGDANLNLGQLSLQQNLTMNAAPEPTITLELSTVNPQTNLPQSLGSVSFLAGQSAQLQMPNVEWNGSSYVPVPLSITPEITLPNGVNFSSSTDLSLSGGSLNFTALALQLGSLNLGPVVNVSTPSLFQAAIPIASSNFSGGNFNTVQGAQDSLAAAQPGTLSPAGYSNGLFSYYSGANGTLSQGALMNSLGGSTIPDGTGLFVSTLVGAPQTSGQLHLSGVLTMDGSQLTGVELDGALVSGQPTPQIYVRPTGAGTYTGGNTIDDSTLYDVQFGVNRGSLALNNDIISYHTAGVNSFSEGNGSSVVLNNTTMNLDGEFLSVDSTSSLQLQGSSYVEVGANGLHNDGTIELQGDSFIQVMGGTTGGPGSQIIVENGASFGASCSLMFGCTTHGLFMTGGNIVLNGGTMDLSVFVPGVLSKLPPGSDLNSVSLTNNGGTIVLGGSQATFENSTIVNTAGWTVAGDVFGTMVSPAGVTLALQNTAVTQTGDLTVAQGASLSLDTIPLPGKPSTIAFTHGDAFNIQGDVSFGNGSSATGIGSTNVSGALSIDNSSLQTNTLNVSSAGQVWLADAAILNANQWTNFGNITVSGGNNNVSSLGTQGQGINSGVLHVTQGNTLNTGSLLNQNGGLVQIDAALGQLPTLLAANGLYTQNDGGTTILNGGLTATQVLLQGGVFQGTGQVTTANGFINSGGVVEPGDAIGKLTIQGDYTQGPNGTLAIEVAGLNDFDELAINGAAYLDGTLKITLDDSELSSLQLGNTFDFLTASAGISGEFSQYDFLMANGSAFPAYYTWDVNYSSDGVDFVWDRPPDLLPLAQAAQNGTSPPATLPPWGTGTLPSDVESAILASNCESTSKFCVPDLTAADLNNAELTTHVPAGPSAVPEPGTMTLVIPGLAALLLYRCRIRGRMQSNSAQRLRG